MSLLLRTNIVVKNEGQFLIWYELVLFHFFQNLHLLISVAYCWLTLWETTFKKLWSALPNVMLCKDSCYTLRNTQVCPPNKENLPRLHGGWYKLCNVKVILVGKKKSFVFVLILLKKSCWFNLFSLLSDLVKQLKSDTECQ